MVSRGSPFRGSHFAQDLKITDVAFDVKEGARFLASEGDYEQRQFLLQFVSDASQELKTPMSSLKELSESLSDGALEAPKLAQRFVEYIASGTQSKFVHQAFHPLSL